MLSKGEAKKAFEELGVVTGVLRDMHAPSLHHDMVWVAAYFIRACGMDGYQKRVVHHEAARDEFQRACFVALEQGGAGALFDLMWAVTVGA